jgi:hypothetical protein
VDSKSGMNLGGARFSSLIADLSDTVDRVNDKMTLGITRASTFANILSSSVSRLSSVANQAFAGGGGGVQSSANTIMQQPTPRYSGLLGPNGQPLPSTIMPQPDPAQNGGGNNNNGTTKMSDMLSPGQKKFVAQAITGYSLMSQALPDTNKQVGMNLLTNRAMAYGLQDPNSQPRSASFLPGFLPAPFNNTREEAYNRVSGVQRQFSQRGTVTDPMDAPLAMAAGQQMGIGMALPGYENLLAGVGTMSNLTPGAGLQNSMGAYAALQQGRSVNMLRSIGIQIRDPMTGGMKSFKDIANSVWDKLSREKLGTEPITKEDLDMGFQPGNSLDQLLNNYFGSDEYLRSQVKAALYARASGVGKSYKKSELQKAGFTTEAITSFSDRQTKSMEGLQQTARAGAGALTVSNNAAEAMQHAANAMDRLTGALSGGSFLKGIFSGFGGMAGGTPSTMMGMLLSALGIGTKAEGGSVGGSKPYVVGEKGPELFLPKSDGVIIPNHLLNTNGRHEGGGVRHSHAWGADPKAGIDPMKVGDVTNILKQAGFKGQGLQNALTILERESGYNPNALNPNKNTGDYSLGLFQINMLGDLYKERMNKVWTMAGTGPFANRKKFKLGKMEDLYDPLTNARVAYHMSKGGADFSSWSTNHYLKDGKPGPKPSPSASSDGNDDGNFFSSAMGSLKEFLGKFAPDVLSTIQGSSGQMGGGGATNNNYGGVTINVSGAKDPKKVASEVKDILSSGDLRSFIGGN